MNQGLIDAATGSRNRLREMERRVAELEHKIEKIAAWADMASRDLDLPWTIEELAAGERIDYPT